MPPPGALLHGAAAGDLRPQTLSPLGPRSPSAPGSPCGGEKTAAISPRCPLVHPATVLSLSPAHHVVPDSAASAAPLLPAQPRTFAPLGPAGPRSPGKPITLPSATSACGQGAVRASTQGTPEGAPRGSALPKPLCRGTGRGHPSPEVQVASSSHHLPWAPGALGGQASRPCPGEGEKNRSYINRTAGHGRAEPSRYGHSWPPPGIPLPPGEPPVPPRGPQHGGTEGTVSSILAHLLAPVALLAPVTL